MLPNSGDAPIIVTGASGFIGANLCRYFLARQNKVLAIEAPNGLGWRLPQDAALTRRRLDLCDHRAVDSLLRDVQPKYIIHCAAYGAYANQTDIARIYDVNFRATQGLLEAIRAVGSVQAFVQMGSSSEYGKNCSAPSEEGAAWPDSHYAVSKVAASALSRFYALKYAVPAFVFRLYSVYGPLEDASRLIPQLLLRAREGKLPPLVNPNISRDFVYVDDVARAIEALFGRAATANKGDYYNIGSGICSTLRSLVDVATELFSIGEKPSWGSMPARHWDHDGWYANPAHAQEALGWRATTSLNDGLSATMTWMQNNPRLVADAIKHTVATA